MDNQQAEVLRDPDVVDAPVPTASTSRIASLDFIRGFAVLGILAANIIAFGQPFSAYMWPEAFLTEHDPAADWMWVAQFVLIDGKMRGLFTVLFGAGLALFVERMDARGTSGSLQMRRLTWLLAFGLLHFFFIWRGDILVLYALLGFVAVAFVRWPPVNQLILGLLGYGLGALVYFLTLGSLFFIESDALGEFPGIGETGAVLAEVVTETKAEDALETQILTQGSYADFIQHNFSVHYADALNNALFFALETLPLMLIGMAFYKSGLFSGGLNRRKQLVWGWAGVVSGSLATLWIALWIKDTGFTYFGTLGAFLSYSHLPRLPVVLGLAALLALWGGHATGWLGQRFAAAGRMAFSNYLGTSILMMLVFHPWAGGLFGKLDRAQLYIVVALAWVVMLGWSKPWLARFRYGPLEYLWRCLTYWRLFPMRREQAEG